MKYVYFLHDDGVITGGDTKIFKVRNVSVLHTNPRNLREV